MTNGRGANLGSPPGSDTGPVLLWLVVQLAALFLAAFRVPLAAKYPQPAESLATHVLLAVQVAASAMLFPHLMPNWRTTAAIIATGWPFAAIASILSAVPLARMAAAEAYVTVWLLALALWRAVLREHRLSLYGVALATTVSIGGAALYYFRLEFGPIAAGSAVGGNGYALIALSPIAATLRQLSAPGMFWTGWLAPISLAAAAAVALLLWHRRRDRLSTAPAPAPA